MRGGDVALVELAGHKRAGEAHLRELVPQRFHRAGTHPAQRAGEPGRAILQALGPHLGDVRRSAPLEAGKNRQRAPVVDKGLDAFPLDSLGERLVVSSTLVARILVQPGMGADRQQREDPLWPPRRDVEGEPSAHRVAGEVRLLEAELVPQRHQVIRAGVHRTRLARRGLRLAVTAEVRHDPSPTFGHLRDDLPPAAAALSETVQECHRRSVAGQTQ